MNGRTPQGFPVVDLTTEPTNRVTYFVNYHQHVANTLQAANVDGFQITIPVPQGSISDGATPPGYGFPGRTSTWRPAAALMLAAPSSASIGRS